MRAMALCLSERWKVKTSVALYHLRIEGSLWHRIIAMTHCSNSNSIDAVTTCAPNNNLSLVQVKCQG